MTILPEPEGPWSFPPEPPPSTAAQTPQARRNWRGLALWVGLVALGGLLFFGLQAVVPGKMTGQDQAYGLQLLGILALVSSGLVYARGINLGVAARNAAIWVGLLAVILLGYSFRNTFAEAFQRIRGELLPAYAMPAGAHAQTINASEDGGFYVNGQANGAGVRFVIDTGAGGVVLSPDDAAKAGIDVASLKFTSPNETANGVGYTAPVTLKALDIGQIHLANVPAEVLKTPMSSSLLGMAFLRRLDGFEVKGDQMTLHWKGG